MSGGETLTRILVPAGEGGLEANLAIYDNILAVRKTYLEQGTYGQVSPEALEQIQWGILVAGIF